MSRATTAKITPVETIDEFKSVLTGFLSEISSIIEQNGAWLPEHTRRLMLIGTGLATISLNFQGFEYFVRALVAKAKSLNRKFNQQADCWVMHIKSVSLMVLGLPSLSRVVLVG